VSCCALPYLEINGFLLGVCELTWLASKECRLLTFDLAHPDTLPTLARVPQRGEDQLQATPIREKPQHGPGTPTLFQETTLQQIGCANAFVMDRRIAEIGNAGMPDS
jgi:hypothetical protein